MAARRGGKSRQWAAGHVADGYVQKARRLGYRARSAFKLEEIDRGHRLVRPASRIIDLGAAPGGWSQYVAGRIGDGNQVIAVDRLPMKPLDRVRFIHGDFTAPRTVARIREQAGGDFDLVLSDMAPNITGIRVTDQANFEILQHAIMDFLGEFLKPGGVLLSKFFEGESARGILAGYRAAFHRVQVIKPDASRSRSSEIYLLGRGYRRPGDG